MYQKPQKRLLNQTFSISGYNISSRMFQIDNGNVCMCAYVLHIHKHMAILMKNLEEKA